MLLQSLQTRGFDFMDLAGDQLQPCHLAAQFGQRVVRQRRSFGGSQGLEPRRRVAQIWLEPADAKPRQRALEAVDDAGALADQRLAFAPRSLGILLFQARDRDHLAVVGFAAQPAEKGPLQQRGVEPVGLRPAMLARDRDAVGMDHLGVDVARPQPARQPHPVAAGLEGDRNPPDLAPGPFRLGPP
jgi:hypothetical protein